MNTELQVSLMCGRHIVDARAIHQGGLFRIPASAPFRFERLPPQTELDPEDAEVVIDFRDREPLLALPEGVRGEMAEGALPEAVSPGPRVLGDGSRGWVTLGQTTLYIQHGPIRPRPLGRGSRPEFIGGSIRQIARCWRSSRARCS